MTPFSSCAEPFRRVVITAGALGIAVMGWSPAAMAEPVGAATRADSRPGWTATIEVIGTSTTGDAGGSAEIYSVVVGDPRPAEELAYFWSGRYGMHGLDATLWTRVTPEGSAQWRQIVLRRPSTPAEIETVTARAASPTAGLAGEAGLLPVPFRGLAGRELARLDYVVEYFLGGTRAVLRVGATRADAEAIRGHAWNQMRRQ